MLKWLALAALVVAADQVTKFLVTAALAYGDEVPLLPVLSLVRWHNEGAAFSFLNDASGWQRWVLAALAVGFVIFILFELRRLPAGQRIMGWVYGLVMGGAIGNLADRVQHGYVVDFVLLHWRSYYFPAFNVADSALFVGAVLWIGVMIAEYRRERARQAS